MRSLQYLPFEGYLSLLIAAKDRYPNAVEIGLPNTAFAY